MSRPSNESLNFPDREKLICQLRSGQLNADETISAINHLATVGYPPDVSEIEESLNHRDAVVRISALNALTFAFTSYRCLDKILEILRGDDDDDVRCSAAIALGYLGRGGVHPEIQRILAETARNHSESDFLRTASYEAYLQSTDLSGKEGTRIHAGDLTAVDWTLLP